MWYTWNRVLSSYGSVRAFFIASKFELIKRHSNDVLIQSPPSFRRSPILHSMLASMCVSATDILLSGAYEDCSWAMLLKAKTPWQTICKDSKVSSLTIVHVVLLRRVDAVRALLWQAKFINAQLRQSLLISGLTRSWSPRRSLLLLIRVDWSLSQVRWGGK